MSKMVRLTESDRLRQGFGECLTVGIQVFRSRSRKWFNWPNGRESVKAAKTGQLADSHFVDQDVRNSPVSRIRACVKMSKTIGLAESESGVRCPKRSECLNR